MNEFEMALQEARGRELEGGRLSEIHLADLRESGLSDETILKAGLATVSAEAARAYLGYPPGASCLVFEYPPLDGQSNYYRLKPERPRQTEDGGLLKYLARSGSGNRLYIPPILDPEVLGDAEVPLLITEGEKKALRGVQDGYAVLGLSGVYGWRTKDSGQTGATEPIPELDGITWSGRTVHIVFDSDGASNAEVRAAEEKLAAELGNRGARVLLARLPELEGENTGLDDLLVAKGRDALNGLLQEAAPPADVFFEGRTFVPVRLARELAARMPYMFARDAESGGGRLYRHQGGVWRPADGLVQEEAHHLLGEKSRNERITEGVDALRREVPVELTQLNGEPDLINVRNGMLDPYKGELLPHDPGYRSTIQLPVHWDPEGHSEELNEFLSTICGEWEDEICELVGYLLTPLTMVKKLFILHGTTNTGKTTFLNLVRAVIGPHHCASVPLQHLGDPTQRFATAQLENRLVNVFDDLPSRRIEDSGTLKALTGGTPEVIVERKYEQAYRAPNICRHLYTCNELPTCTDKNEAWYDRLAIFSFEHYLSEKEQDVHLRSRFGTDVGIRQAMLVRAVQGLCRLKKRGWVLEGSQDALEAYRQKNDPVMGFVDERCKVGPELEIRRTQLREAYRDYCLEESLSHPLSARSFYERIRGDRRFSEKKITGERYFAGLALGGDGQ